MGQGEIDVDRIKRLQRDNRRAALDELPEIDLANAGATREWRANGFFRNDGADGVGVGDRLPRLRLAGIEFGLRVRVLRPQILGTLQVDAGEVGAGFGAGQLRQLRGNIELHQQVTLVHLGARLEGDLDHRAIEFVGHGDAFHGRETAHRVQAALPDLLRGLQR